MSGTVAIREATAAVWFDFGGVLSPPIPELFAAYERKTGITPGQLQTAMAEVAAESGLPPLATIELAHASEAEWGRALGQALGRAAPAVDLSVCDLERFGVRWFEDIEVNAGMVELLIEVRDRGHKVGILTNNVVEWETIWRRIVDLDDVIDAIVDSCKVGVRKPDPEIFKIAAIRLKTPADHNVLIDDVPENCAAARASGWSAINFRNNSQTADALRKLLDGWEKAASGGARRMKEMARHAH